ncbi:hypothetical protein D3C78_1698900 [compost metagenome]
MRGGRQCFQHCFHRRRQAAQRFQLLLVAGEFGLVRQLAVYQQVGHFLEFGIGGQVQNVVAAVVQVVAAAANGAQLGIAGGDAGEGDGFLGFGKHLE